MKTITQTEFIEGISTRFENKAQAQAAFKTVIEGIASVLKAGDSLSIKGFGSFKVEERAARKGRNPRTGQEIEIPASRAVKFTASSLLKDEIKGAEPQQ
ncbi:MAG: HU family DNA-binding protein [Desulfovibrio sp.]|nr:HU family DNA-binding protein [Desulfovibrio sp.]